MNLPTLAEVAARRAFKPQPKAASRLQVKTEAVKSEAKDEQRWKAEVWKRDQGLCRWCHRKVQKTIAFVPDRGEVHHAVPRANRVTRWDVRASLLLCLACHQRITGVVNERFILVAKKTFTSAGVEYPDVSKAVSFKRVA